MLEKITSVDHTIGALGKLTGVNIETIRYYERIGLLPGAARTSSNYRVYGDTHVRRLTFIREVDALVVEQMREVERKIADLERLWEELDRLAHQCRGGLVSDCRIIEALSP